MLISEVFQCYINGRGGEAASEPCLKRALPAVTVPEPQDPACGKPGEFMGPFPLGRGEKNGFCCKDGTVETHLSPQEPGDRERRTCRRVVGKLYTRHAVCVVVVLAVLVALVLALAAAVAVLSAGRGGEDAAVAVAPVLACPEDWVGYRHVCYYLSKEEGSWEWSREQCSSHGAWLAVLRREWEMEFLWRLKGNVDFWIGLQRRGERLEWADGSSFNQTLVVHGQEACVYLNDGLIASSRCSQQRPYICSKPQALMGTR